jgi:hypothetical protein
VGPALTCQIPLTPQVSPPRSCAWRMLSAPCATMSVGNDGWPSAPTSGPCQRPPPPRPAPFLDDAAVVAVVIRRRCIVPPPPPFQPTPVRVLGGVQRIGSRCGKRASVVAFFSAPAVAGGHVVAVAAPVLLGAAAVGAREAPAPTPHGQGWSCHPTAKPGALSSSPTPTLPPPRSFFSLLPLPLSRWMALANSTARSSARQHRPRRSSPFSMTTTQVLDDDDDDGIDDVTAMSHPPRNAADGDRDAPLSDG